MVPLKSASASTPALGPPLLLWILLCLVGLVVGAVGAAVVRRLSNPVGKFRLLYLLVVLPYGLVAYGLLAILDFGAAVQGALVSELTGIFDVLFAVLVTWLAASIVGLATYAPTIRAVRAVRDVDLGTGTALRQMARYLFGISILMTACVVVLRRLAGGEGGTLGLLIALLAFALLFFAGAPWAIAAVRSTRSPTDDENQRLTRLRERAGLTVRDTVVLLERGADTATVLVRGVPGLRRLFVSDAFLDAFDDDVATALLAVQAGRVRSHALFRRIGTAIAAALPIFLAVSDSGPAWVLVLSSCVVLLVGLWVSRRGILAADEYAAGRVGAVTLAEALGRYAESHALETSHHRFPNPLSANVPLGDRIDRLRGQDGSDHSDDDDGNDREDDTDGATPSTD